MTSPVMSPHGDSQQQFIGPVMQSPTSYPQAQNNYNPPQTYGPTMQQYPSNSGMVQDPMYGMNQGYSQGGM